MAGWPSDVHRAVQLHQATGGSPAGDGASSGVGAEWPVRGEADGVYPLATVEVEQQDDVSVARLHGEIDTSNVAEIGEALSAAAMGAGSHGMVVDLSGVAYLNSATVKLLFDLAEDLHKRHRQMRLVMTETAPMRKLILLLKFDLVVPLDNTIEDALAKLRPRGAAADAADGTQVEPT